MATKTLSLVTYLLLTYCGLVCAQARPARHGVWLEGALGEGWVHVSSDTLRGRNQSGNDVILALGGTLGSRVRAGIGVDQWASEWGGGKQNWITSFNILVYYYPLARSTFFLEAGAGRADYSVVHVPAGGERADSVYLSGTAWGPTVAAGWDAPLWTVFSLRPRLSYSYGPPRSLHSPDGTLVAAGWKQHLLSVDVGIVLQDSW